MFTLTTATKKTLKLSKRIRALPGGTSAGKTIGIMSILINLCQADKKPTLTSVVSESFPHLRRGAIRDFLNILKEHEYYVDSRWNKTDSIYTFETGSMLEFFSADQSHKLRGGRRDRLFINEANNIAFSAFEELEVRTKDFIFLDWNPTHEFWYYTHVKPSRDDVEELTLTYKDNEALDEGIIKSIEKRKNRAGWWKVYGLGQLGELEERIYTGWLLIDKIPHQARLVSRGLDFGFTNDPSVLVNIYEYNGGYIIDEVFSMKGMSNRRIAEYILLLDNQSVVVIADSAEPKSIDEIRSYGINITGANKERGSVAQGISYIQDQKISITKNSLNTIKSYRNYLWLKDKEGNKLNVPCHDFSDEMDAIRYGMTIFMRSQNTTTNINSYKDAYKKYLSS